MRSLKNQDKFLLAQMDTDTQSAPYSFGIKTPKFALSVKAGVSLRRTGFGVVRVYPFGRVLVITAITFVWGLRPSMWYLP